MEDTVQANKRALRKQKGNGGQSKHHAQSDAGKENGNGGHFLEKQKRKARKSQVGRKHRGNGGHSPNIQKRTGRAKGERRTLSTSCADGRGEGKEEWRTLSREAKGESRTVPRWKGNTKGMKTLSREQKGDWGIKRGLENTLNVMRRRKQGRKRGMEDTI